MVHDRGNAYAKGKHDAKKGLPADPDSCEFSDTYMHGYEKGMKGVVRKEIVRDPNPSAECKACGKCMYEKDFEAYDSANDWFFCTSGEMDMFHLDKLVV